MSGCVYAMVIPEWRKLRTTRRHRIDNGLVKKGLIKIGHVISPENLKPRRASLCWEYRTDFVGLYAVETHYYLEEEEALHKEFAPRNIPIHKPRQGRGKEGREFFDLNSKEAIEALKRLRGARAAVKPIESWSVSGKAGQKFDSEKWENIEERDGIEDWEDSILIYVCSGYTGQDVDRGIDIEEDYVWFGQDVPYLLAQGGEDDFKAVAKVTLSDGWEFLPEDPGSDFPWWWIEDPKGNSYDARDVLNGEAKGATVIRI